MLDAPSLYDAALHHLAGIGIDIPADRLDRDWAQPYVSSPGDCGRCAANSDPT